MSIRDILEALAGLLLVLLGMNAAGDPDSSWLGVIGGCLLFGFGFWMITDSVRPRA